MLRQKLLSPAFLVYVTYSLCAILWGTGWFAIRLCVSDGGYPVLGGAALRYTIAALLLLLALPFFPQCFARMKRGQFGWLLLAGVFNAVAIGLLYWGEKIVSGGLASVLVATSPLIVAMLVLATRTEPVKTGSIGGFCLALGGVALIFWERLCVSPSHLLAMGAILGAALFFSIVNVIMKLKVGEVKSLQSSAIFFAAMSLVFWLACPCEAAPGMPWPPPAIPTCALVYLSVACSAIAFPAFCYLLRHSSLMFASTLSFVHPVIALLTDCALEHNFVLSLSAYAGISIVLIGLSLSIFANREHVKRGNTAAST